MLELFALPDTPTEELDCLTCSACCRGHAGVILVTAEDLLRFRSAGRPELAERIVPGHFSEEAMETDAAGACVHLGRPGLPHHCSIYEIRPNICGEFERGSWQCLEARRFAEKARKSG
jgi:Fe-S-cluster containining protein